MQTIKKIGFMMFSVFLLTALLSCETPPPAPVSFAGEDGRGIRLAVLVPDAMGLLSEEDYLPSLVQGVLVDDFSRFSAISVLDRMSLESVLAETESGIYQTDEDFGRLGEIANVDYVLTGSVARTGTGHALHIRIVGTGRDNIGITRASFSGTPTVAEMDDFTGIRRASMELLTQMGVSLTGAARQELSGVVSQQSINAQIALAQGHNAQRAGTEMVALSYFIQAALLDPSLAEAVSRKNTLAANIFTGNMGDVIRADIEWRDLWVAKLGEVRDLFISHTYNLPFYVVYSTSIEHLGTDFNARTAEFRSRIGIIHDAEYFIAVNRVMRTVMAAVRNGLFSTGRAAVWGLDDWLRPAGGHMTLPQHGIRNSSVEIELFNANGQRLSRQVVNLRHGWERLNNPRWYHANPVVTMFQDVIFRSVDANLITDIMTIQINSIDGIPAEEASRQRRLSIVTEQNYNNIISVMANGLDFPNLQRFGIDSRGRPSTIIGETVIREHSRANQGIMLIERRAQVSTTSTLIIPYGVIYLGSLRHTIGGRSYPIDLTDVTEIVIPESVFKINLTEFPSLPRLRNITIPDSVVALHLGLRPGLPPFGAGAGLGRLNRIIVPANLDIQTPINELSGDDSFRRFYVRNGRRAGTYVFSAFRNFIGIVSPWSFQPSGS